MLLINNTKRPLHVRGVTLPPKGTEIGKDDKVEEYRNHLFVRCGWVTLSEGNKIPKEIVSKKESSNVTAKKLEVKKTVEKPEVLPDKEIVLEEKEVVHKSKRASKKASKKTSKKST